MRVIIFGTGKLYLRNREKLSDMEIVAFLDNDSRKQGVCLDGKRIDSPENVGNYEYDYILLVSVHYKEMRQQLEKQGIESNVIIDVEHRGCWDNIRKVQKYDFVENSTANKKILLVTHDFSLTGAPLMLYYAARILKENGYGVTIFTKADGQLKHDYLRYGISVSLFENYEFCEEEMRNYFSGYQMILVNTVVLFKLVSGLDRMNIPVLWWLHEEDNVYEEYQIKELPEYKKLRVYGVGARVVNSYIKYSGRTKIEQLIYGIPLVKREGTKKNRNNTGKIIYAIIGCVSERKGHDSFMASLEKNWDRWKKKAEFWVIGIITQQQKAEMEATHKVRVFGSVDHNRLAELYSEIDVVVCPSRNDPMPVVLAEGMMNEKVCIASNMTGTAEKIVPFKNGLICQSGNVESLSEQIDWVLENRDRLEKMGKEAYKVYEREFSWKQFQKKLLKTVNDIINEEICK